MIVLERSYPLKALLDEFLLMRLPKNYPKITIIEEDLRREMSGHRGEKALDYYLDFLPQEQYYIFQHLRLKFEKFTFQIDFLLLTTKFALIIEAKNYKGNLLFENQFDQLIQTYDDEEKVYENPIEQAQRQQRLLKKWFETYLSQYIPIDYLVVMSNSHAILKSDSKEIPKKVCKPYKLLHKIEELEKQYPKDKIDLITVQKLCELLLKHHTPKQYNLLEEYKIPKKDILPGCRCPKCKALPMVYKTGKWHCKKCQYASKDAHVASLQDYFLLIKPSITNAEFREFFHLPSRNIAQKLLAHSNLKVSGSTRNRVYHPIE